MLLHAGFNVIWRTAKCSNYLFPRLRCFRIAVISTRNFEASNNKDVKRMERDSSVLEKVLISRPQTTGQKVKEKATNAYLYSAYLVSVVVMAGMSYLLYEEVFSPAGPQAVFSKAMSLIRSDPDCQRLLGNSVVGYGEGRGRIKRIAHHTYQKDGSNRIRVVFSVKGSRREGITTAEMEKVDNKWRWRFLIVSTTDLIPETVILIDNR